MSGRHILEERSKLDVGIAEFDGQNRDIHSLLERLRSATANQYGYATSTILGELNTQMRITFAVQESLMRLLAFPDTEAHDKQPRQVAGTEDPGHKHGRLQVSAQTNVFHGFE